MEPSSEGFGEAMFLEEVPWQVPWQVLEELAFGPGSGRGWILEESMVVNGLGEVLVEMALPCRPFPRWGRTAGSQCRDYSYSIPCQLQIKSIKY